MANGKIPLGDLPVKTPGNFDYLAGSQLGDAYRFPVPEVTNAARLLSESLGQVVADAEADIAPVIAGLGYQPPVPYASGLNVNSTRFTVIRDGQVYAPAAPVPFTTGAWNAGQWRLVQGVTGADLSASTGAGMVGFSHAGFGITRSLLAKARDRVSVKEFGAVGDGAADDTTAIETAQAQLPDGVDLFFPDGVYRTTRNIVMSDRAGFGFVGNGPGTVFRPELPSGSSENWLQISNSTDVEVGGFTIDASTSPTLVRTRITGINRLLVREISLLDGEIVADIRNSTNVTARDLSARNSGMIVSIINCQGGVVSGLRGDRIRSALDFGGGTNGNSGFVVSDIRASADLSDNRDEGIEIGGLRNSSISNCVLQGFRKGVQIKAEAGTDWGDLTLSGIVIDGYVLHGIDAQTGEGVTSASGRLSIVGCQVFSDASTLPTATGIYLNAQKMRSVSVLGCRVHSPWRGVDVEAADVDDVSVCSNEVHSGTHNGVRIVLPGSSRRFIVASNLITTATSIGISISNAGGGVISGNVIGGGQYGVRTLNVEGIVVTGNVVEGASVDGMWFETSHGTMCSDNRISGAGEYGVRGVNSWNMAIQGNTLENTNGGLHLTYSSTPAGLNEVLGLRISDNSIGEWGHKSTGTRNCITIRASTAFPNPPKAIHLTDNLLFNRAAPSVGSQARGILFDNLNGAQGCRVTGNTLVKSRAVAVNLDAALSVEDNLIVP